MVLGLLIGFGVGLNVGMWFSAFLWKRTYRSIIDGYRKDVDNWFNEYMQMRKWYNEMSILYVKEATKNIFK